MRRTRFIPWMVFFLWSTIAVVLCQCSQEPTEAPGAQAEEGSAESFGGGDFFNALLGDIREYVLQRAVADILVGKRLDSLCRFENLKSSKSSLYHQIPPLNQPKIAYCKDFLVSMASGLSKALQSPDIRLAGIEGKLIVNGEPVSARVILSGFGMIEISIERVLALGLQKREMRLLLAGLLGHEFLHMVPHHATNAFIKDRQTIGPFDSSDGGSELLNTAGLALADYGLEYLLSYEVWDEGGRDPSAPPVNPFQSGPVQRVDFGGIYSYQGDTLIPNKVTGDKCAPGYFSASLLGETGATRMFYCYRPHAEGRNADVDFGGAWGWSNLMLVGNAAHHGAASCPITYHAVQASGPGVDNEPYPFYYCYREHTGFEETQFNFGGFYRTYGNVSRGNEATGDYTCPSGYDSYQIFGGVSQGEPLFYCLQQSVESHSYFGISLSEPLVDFGGMYSSYEGDLVPNPITGHKCPEGYIDSQIVGPPMPSAAVDSELHYCHRPHVKGKEAEWLFGGAWGYLYPNYPVGNIVTNGTASCPLGYTMSKIYGRFGIDLDLYFCFQRNPGGEKQLVNFGGFFSSIDNLSTGNAATGDFTCPSGYKSSLVLGLPGGYDPPVSYCVQL